MKTLVQNTAKFLALFVMFSGAASVAQAGGKHGGGGSHASHSSGHHAPAHASAPAKHAPQHVKSSNPVKPVSGGTKSTNNMHSLGNVPNTTTAKQTTPKTTTTDQKKTPATTSTSQKKDPKTTTTGQKKDPKTTTGDKKDPKTPPDKKKDPKTPPDKKKDPKTNPGKKKKKHQQPNDNSGDDGSGSGGFGGGSGGFGGGSGGGGYDDGSAGGFSDDAPVASNFSGSADPVFAAGATPNLQVVGVQAVDSGSAAAHTGPRYRVTVRNAGDGNADNEFMVNLSGSTQQGGSPMFSGSRLVNGLAAGATTQVDIRMPYSGSRLPASMYMTATADSQ